MKKSTKSRGTLTTKHWMGYMFGDFGGCMTFALMAGIFSSYCTDILHINATIMGILTIVWAIWDAINDPMMGALMDRAFAKRQNKNGKFRPWLLRATPLLAVTAIALWTVPTFFDGIATLVALFSFKVLYEGAYTMFNIPMGSLLSAMSTSDVERASLSSARGVGSMFGNMIPGIVAPAILGLIGKSNPVAYMVVGVSFAVVGFVLCLLHYALTEERVVVNEKTDVDEIKLTDIFGVVKKNRAFIALCIHGISICTMQYLIENISIQMYTGVYGDPLYKSLGTILSAPFMAGAMIFVPFMCKKFGLEKIIRYTLLVGGAICAGLFVMHMFMYVHPLIHGLLLGTGSGFAMVSIQMQWGLVGEAIDYNEFKTGKRTEGSIYGTFNLSRRIGQAIGMGFSFFALDWIRYDSTLPVQSASTIFGFKVICVLLPALCVLGSWAAFKFVWNITPEIRAKMSAAKLAESDASTSEEKEIQE